MNEVRRCIFEGCVSTDRHWHGGFPGGYDDPADPLGMPLLFTSEPAPGVRDYNGALLDPDPRSPDGWWTDEYAEETNAALNFGQGYAEGLAARRSTSKLVLTLGLAFLLGFGAGWVLR